MNKKILRGLIIGVLFVGVWKAKATPEQPFLYQDLKDLIKNQKITSIESLIPLIPETMKQNPLLVYDSHALKLELVNPASPRTILVNDDASLILAFTKYPGASAVANGEDTVEVISFDRQTNQFEMRDLVFNGVETPFSKNEPEVNPKLCLGCHGSNPRPIFQDYNAWPGFYGSYSHAGISVKGTPEHANLETFLKSMTGMSRYKDLKPNVKQTDGYIQITSTVDNRFSPNFLFGQKIERLMYRRAAQKLIDNSDARAFVAYFGDSTPDLDCGSIRDRWRMTYRQFTSTEPRKVAANALLAKIESQVKKDYEFKKQEFFKFNTPHNDFDDRGVISIPASNLFIADDPYYYNDTVAYQNQLVLLETLLREWGFDTDDVSTFPKNPMVGIHHIHGLGLYIDEQYFIGVAWALREMDPSFAQYLESDCNKIYKTVYTFIENLQAPEITQSGIFYRKD